MQDSTAPYTATPSSGASSTGASYADARYSGAPYPGDADASSLRRARPWRNAFLIALLAFVGGAAVVTWALTRWAPARALIEPAVVSAPVTAPAPAYALPPTAVGADPTAVAVTESRVTGLEARIAQIDAQASTAAANAARAEGLLVAFAARRAVDGGRPLGYIEGQLRDRFAATQPRAVAAIISAAQAPATLDRLRQQFDALAPDLVGGAATETWGDAAQRTISTLFVVRRADEASPVPDARLARARTALDGGQVDVALAEIARLPGAAKAADWMAGARRWIEAHRALDIVEAAALVVPPPVTGAMKERP